MRELDVPTPHFTDRVNEARRLVTDRELTPALAGQDRELLADALQILGRAVDERGGQQILHGEPHPGNLLTTTRGPLFVDLETCCRGPVEFDLAHAPEAVAEHYPDADGDLLRDCRLLVLAMITAAGAGTGTTSSRTGVGWGRSGSVSSAARSPADESRRAHGSVRA